MNELMLGEVAFASTFPSSFPSITGVQDTCEFPLAHLAVLVRTSFSSGMVLTWVVPMLRIGGETRGGGVTFGRNGVPKVYARSRLVIIIFGKVGEGCRTKS